MDGGDDRTVQRAVKLAPFARRNDRPGREAHRLQHRADLHRIGRKHFAQQRHGWFLGSGSARRLDRAVLRLIASELEHRPGEDVLGFRMRRHAEARHVDADDANAVDLLGQKPQRHARSGGHAKIHDDDRVVLGGIGKLEDRFADVLEELSGHQRFGIERNVAHRPLRAIKMRSKRQPIDATR